MSLTNIIRNAVINNTVRSYTISEIQSNANVSRAKAKQLLFSFIWYAKEEHLQSIVNEE